MQETSKRADIQPSGMLNKEEALRNFKLEFYNPPKSLEGIVRNIWHVHWDLPEGQSYRQENLPHPTQHVVIDSIRGSGLTGCFTQKFDYDVAGKGQVLGVKLYAGMGGCFLKQDMSNITNTQISLESLIGEVAGDLERRLKAGDDIPNIITSFGVELAKICTEPDKGMFKARALAEYIESTAEITRVSELTRHFDLTSRQIQRLFSKYIGVPPKWVIDRFRMLEAVDVLNSGRRVDLSELALELGYTDQAHFSNKFKTITGMSPSAYRHQT